MENTRYARVFHSRQWSNYNITPRVSDFVTLCTYTYCLSLFDSRFPVEDDQQ